jgi:glycosyltransferase involved in cell wall biosynthesis
MRFELSVLIPVFNADIRPLVQILHHQCQELDLLFEIRCYDDGSHPDVIARNLAVRAFSHTRYELLPRHLGRVAIRNQLAREALYGYLLFLDNDSQVISPTFIRDYLQALSLAPVLVGGTCYLPLLPAAPFRLHWHFGRSREEKPARYRNRAPYRSFYLNNILLPGALFLRYPLLPLPRDYGHEDSRFGRQLEVAGIPVHHLDNPVLHAGLEPAAVFLSKSREAIENLYWLYRQEGIGTGTRLVRLYRGLKKFKLVQFYLFGYQVLESLILRNLHGPAPALWLFDLYKLYYFIREGQQKESPATGSGAK